MFNPVTHYGYLLPNMYLFIEDIANPDSFVRSCRTWISLDITRFCKEHFSHYYCWVCVLVVCLYSCGRLLSVCEVAVVPYADAVVC